MSPIQSNRWRWLITFILASMAASLIYQAAWEKRRTNRSTLTSKHRGHNQLSASSTLITIRTKEGQQLLQHNDMGYCPITGNTNPSSSSTALRRTNPNYIHKPSREELQSPLCLELATRLYEHDTVKLQKGYWSAKVCRFMMRNIKKQVNNDKIPLQDAQVSVCSYQIPYTQFIHYCGKMIMETEAPNDRSIHPYTRQVSQTFFFWNKALAAYCDASPIQMIDDSPDLPTGDYLPHVKTAKTFYVVTNQVSCFHRIAVSLRIPLYTSIYLYFVLYENRYSFSLTIILFVLLGLLNLIVYPFCSSCFTID